MKLDTLEAIAAELKSLANEESSDSTSEQLMKLSAAIRSHAQKQSEDTELLDFLERQSGNIDLTGGETCSWELAFAYPQITDDGSETLRDALRAALRSERRNEGPQSKGVERMESYERGRRSEGGMG